MKTKWILVAALLVFSTNVFAQEQAAAPKKAKNVILFIGDGMGFNTDIAGTFFRFGENQAQRYHKFRQLSAATFGISAADFDEDKEIGYDEKLFWSGLDAARKGANDRTCVTDSAASGTAINWGHKTAFLRIGTDFNGLPVKLFADFMADDDRSVGAVSSVPASNATPAAVKAHQFRRYLYKEIFREQVLDQKGLTVLMGMGHPDYFDGKAKNADEPKDYDVVGGETFWKQLTKHDSEMGVKFIDDAADFASLAAALPDSGTAVPSRVVGIARTAEVLFPYDGVPEGEPNRTDVDVKTLPTLTEMTIGALNVLSKNENGFYLMSEGGAIDYANHDGNLERAVAEHVAFARAVDAAIDWVEKYSSWDETLMIVTADHETGQLWGPATYQDANANHLYDSGEAFHGFMPIVNKGKGVVPDGQYAHNDHTNALVPFWIHGAGAESVDRFIRGTDKTAAEFYGKFGYPFKGEYIYNSDVAKVMKAAAGLEKVEK